MAADEQLSEEDLDMLESAMCMALGNFEQFNGAPYIKRITDRLVEKNIPFTLAMIYNHGDAVKFPWSNGDVVCHHGSYGHKLGLYEFIGTDFLTPEELKRDSVKGNVTLKSALNRIENAYKKYLERQNERSGQHQ